MFHSKEILHHLKFKGFLLSWPWTCFGSTLSTSTSILVKFVKVDRNKENKQLFHPLQ